MAEADSIFFFLLIADDFKILKLHTFVYKKQMLLMGTFPVCLIEERWYIGNMVYMIQY